MSGSTGSRGDEGEVERGSGGIGLGGRQAKVHGRGLAAVGGVPEADTLVGAGPLVVAEIEGSAVVVTVGPDRVDADAVVESAVVEGGLAVGIEREGVDVVGDQLLEGVGPRSGDLAEAFERDGELGAP